MTATSSPSRARRSRTAPLPAPTTPAPTTPAPTTPAPTTPVGLGATRRMTVAAALLAALAGGTPASAATGPDTPATRPATAVTLAPGSTGTPTTVTRTTITGSAATSSTATRSTATRSAVTRRPVAAERTTLPAVPSSIGRRVLAPITGGPAAESSSDPNPGGRGLRTPEAASKNLWDAWRDDDRPRALLYASAAAVRTLFSRRWDAEIRNQGCGRTSTTVRCAYTEGTLTYVVTVTGTRTAGYRVLRVDLLGRDAATAALDPATAATSTTRAATSTTPTDAAGG